MLGADVELVVSNNASAGVFGRVDRLNKQYGLNIRLAHISGLTHPGGPGAKGEQTLEESEAITGLCEGFNLVTLLGYIASC